MGDCAISANRDLKNAVQINGCPPSILDTVLATTKGVLSPARFAKTMPPRLIKYIGMKLKLWDEAFPAFGKYEPPDFDRKHF
jgi:hypothetical protein